MRKVWAVLALAVVASAPAFPQSAKFPAAVVTDSDLTVQRDRAQSTVTGAAMLSSATSFTVTTGSKFAANMILTIDNEQMLACSVVGNTVNVGYSSCPNVDGRGYAGTSPASHANGSLVSANVVAWSHNSLKEEVKAIENALGAGYTPVPNPLPVNKGGTGAQTAAAALASLGAAASGVNFDITSLAALSTPVPVAGGGTGASTLTGVPIAAGTAPFTAVAGSGLQVLRGKPNQLTPAYEFASLPTVRPADYNFPAQTPGGSLTAGNNTVALAPCPLGVNGTDTAHYLRISGGTGAGTNESVLITGGTCTSGSASGTVILNIGACGGGTCHTGAWAVTSPTGGLQEAVLASAAGSTVLVTSPITASAQTTINKALTLSCGSGIGITATSDITTNVILIGASSVTIQGCTMSGNNTADSVVTSIGSFNNLTIAGNNITAAGKGIYVDHGSYIDIHDNFIAGVSGYGILAGFTGPTYVSITNNDVSTVGSTLYNAAAIWTGGNHTRIVGNHAHIGGVADQAILWLNNPGTSLTDGLIASNTMDVLGAGAFECVGIGSGQDFSITGNTCKVMVAATGPAFNGYEINQSARGSVTGNSFWGNNSTATTAGIVLFSSANISVSGNNVSGWGKQIGSNGIYLLHTNTTNPASGQLSGNSIIGNVLTQTDATAVNSDIKLDTLLAGSVLDNLISSNMIYGAPAAGHVCIQVSNSGAATLTRSNVVGNHVNNCDIGVYVSGGTAGRVIDNIISSIGTLPYTILTPTFIHDLAYGITMAQLNNIVAGAITSLSSGSMLYISDATIANPCAGGGSGAILKRLNGVSVCN